MLESENLECDESALTGESLPVSKSVGVIEDAPLAERTAMASRGTTVSRGAAEGVVVAIGMETELGHVATMVDEAESEATPLERRLERLARRLLWLALAVGAVLSGLGIAAGKDPRTIIETAVILAIAAIPEGLPIVSTVALARGVWRMAERSAIVKRLAAVETLGATSVILSDKTGTLTENRMSVHALRLGDRSLHVSIDGGHAELEQDGQAVDPDDRLRELLALQASRHPAFEGHRREADRSEASA